MERPTTVNERKANKRRQLIFCLLLATFFNSYGQNRVTGNWYLISDDMVLQFNFDSSRITMNKLDMQLNLKRQESSSKILNEYERRGNKYYFIEDNNDTAMKGLIIISSINQNKSFTLSWITGEILPPKLRSEKDVEAFIKRDTMARYGIVVYSQTEFNRLTKLKDVLAITKEDYVKFLKEMLKRRDQLKSLWPDSKYKEIDDLFYMFAKSNYPRKILADLGYNPVVQDWQRIEGLYLAFLADRPMPNYYPEFENDKEISELKKELNKDD